MQAVTSAQKSVAIVVIFWRLRRARRIEYGVTGCDRVKNNSVGSSLLYILFSFQVKKADGTASPAGLSTKSIQLFDRRGRHFAIARQIGFKDLHTFIDLMSGYGRDLRRRRALDTHADDAATAQVDELKV